MRVETGVLPERYRDPVRIGHGAMGDIYRARDSLLDREVAVKVLAERYAGDAEIRERFTREALTAARLSSEPGIVTIYDVGEWNGRPFIVMEYLPGGSLEERLRAGVPDLGQAVAWLEEAGRGLDAGHRRGVIHRDVKPGNLLLDANGRVHVADFGIASASGLDSLTMTGTVLGTAGYLAPEQAVGERATPASDRYALGAVAWELLAGRRPFASESPTAEAAAHANAPPPSLCDVRADLPCRELDAVLARALAKDPGERPGSCAEFVADLRHALAAGATTTQVLPKTALAATVPPPEHRRGWHRWAAAALLLAALVAGTALAAALAGGDDQATPTTRVRVRTIRVTQPGTTVTTPVTVTASTPTAPTTAPSGGASGIALTDEATALLNAGRYEEAAAKAQEALRMLGDTGQLYEAYALYNLGAALANLGDCKNAKKALERSQKIQGHRSEIDAAKAICEHGKGAKGD
jgi:tRNA A-37 threonylcarbamoyl transferase component Bud32/tetratricopeptide (TPR) repeat protein